MKKALVLLMFCMAGFTFIACSSDDNSTDLAKGELELEGVWSLETMNFLNKEEIEWDFDNIPFNGGTALGYAPYMFSAAQISGFNFGHGDVLVDDEVMGDRFDYIMRGFVPPKFEETFSYWYWNYKEDKTSFEVVQVGGGGLPADMDYQLYNIRNIEYDGANLEFDADLSTRIPGGDREERIKTTVHYTLSKGTPTEFVEVQIDGEVFEVPEN